MPSPDGKNREQLAHELDHEALHSFLFEACAGDLAIAENLIQVYFESAETLVGLMRASVAKGDYADLRYAAHTLKSSSRIFGASQMARLCDELELTTSDALASTIMVQVDEVAWRHEALQKSLVQICRQMLKEREISSQPPA